MWASTRSDKHDSVIVGMRLAIGVRAATWRRSDPRTNLPVDGSSARLGVLGGLAVNPAPQATQRAPQATQRAPQAAKRVTQALFGIL